MSLTILTICFPDEKVEPQCIEHVTMLFSDIVGFTSICSSCTPLDVINMLQSLYTNFDTCCGELDVYKVEFSCFPALFIFFSLSAFPTSINSSASSSSSSSVSPFSCPLFPKPGILELGVLSYNKQFKVWNAL